MHGDVQLPNDYELRERANAVLLRTENDHPPTDGPGLPGAAGAELTRDDHAITTRHPLGHDAGRERRRLSVRDPDDLRPDDRRPGRFPLPGDVVAGPPGGPLGLRARAAMGTGHESHARQL